MSERALPRSPRPHQPRWCWVAAGLLLPLLWWLLIGQQPVPALQTAAPSSPWQEQVLQQGVLKVAVRSYPRPSLPDAPLPPEPDVLDLAYAQWLADQLQVPLQLQAPEAADLQLQEHAALATGPAALHGYGDTQLQLVVLRQQLPRWHPWAPSVWHNWLPRFLTAFIPAPAADAAPRVCMGTGVAPAAALQARGWQPVVARSSIHAISEFLSGQCDALAESPALIARLLAQPSWRFYAPLGHPWSAQTAAAPQTEDAWLQAMQRRWRGSHAWHQTLQHRTSTLLLEAAMLEDSAICH